MQILLSGQPDERARVVRGLEGFCREQRIPPSVEKAADLALEEHLANVLGHGYAAGAPHRILVAMRMDGDCLCLEVEDDGKAFDPLAVPPVDTGIPLKDKPMGGLGVHLMRQSMDELSYAREDGRNRLRMRKRVPPGAG